MPLSFSAEELDLLLELSRPIEPAQRSAFLDAVAAAIGEQASGPRSRPRNGAADTAGFLDPAAAGQHDAGASQQQRHQQ